MALLKDNLETEERLMGKIQDIYDSARRHQLPINIIRQRLATDVFGTKVFGKLPRIYQYGLTMYDKGMMRNHQVSNTRAAYNLVDEIAFIGEMDGIQQATLARYTLAEAEKAYGYYYPDGTPFETEMHKA